MLKDDFFTLVKLESGQGSLKALISIRKNHPILQGHFPGQPIVPGVCMMQVVKELMEFQLHKKLRLVEAENMKFLAVVDPERHPEIDVAISYTEEPGHMSINAVMFSGDIVFFKLKALLHNF